MPRSAVVSRRANVLPVSPATVFGANLTGWWRADSLSALADGASVSSWPDLSANGNTVTQATPANQPTYVASSIGGKPCVRFTGANATRLIKTTPSTIPNQGPLFVFAILSYSSATTDNAYIEYTDASNDGWSAYLSSSSGSIGWFQPGVSGYTSFGSVGPATPVLVTIGAGGSGDSFNIYGNRDNQRPSMAVVTGAAARTNTSGDLVIGGRKQAGLTGDIAEIILVNRLPTSADRRAIARYAYTRYGINTGSGYNAATTMTNVPPTSTYDGTSQAQEQSVIYDPAGIAGHKYWMAYMPNVPHETPSVIYSDDNVTWSVPAGLTNPILPVPGAGVNGDPHLRYYGGTFYLYYGAGGGTGHDGDRVLTSTDGATWTTAGSGTLLVSNAASENEPIEVYDGTQYWLYTASTSEPCSLFRYGPNSSPGGTYSAATKVTCATPIPGSRSVWHYDIKLNPSGTRFIILATTNTPRYMWFGTTPISDGVNWTFKPWPVMIPNGFGWDSSFYRPSFAYDSVADNYKIWYNSNATQLIGTTTVPTSEVE